MNSIISKVNRIATILLASTALTACGFFSSGSGDHIPTPVISVSPEGATLYVGMEITLSAANSTDQDGDQLSYAWSQPTGQAIALNPTESDTNVTVNFIADAAGSYTFTLTVSDGKYENSTEIVLDILVDEANEPPVFTSSSDPISVSENFSAVVHTAAASDPEDDTLTYSLAGSDAGAFSIDASSGALSFANAPDFEAPTDADGDNTYELSLQASDGKASVSQSLSISVTDVNEAPSITSAASADVTENSTGTIHTAAASDAEGKTLTYTISGTDADDFNIDSSSGALSFAEAPDFEIPSDADGDNTYQLNLEASDGTNTSSQALTISVSNVNEAPTITSAATTSVNENTTGSVYTIAASDVDADDTHTYSIVGGADKALLILDGAELSFVTAPDYETPPASGDNTYEVDLRATDAAGLYAELKLSITVDDVDEQPTLTSVTSVEVDENIDTGTIVYTATASDPENKTLSYQIVAGGDSGAFQPITSAGNQGTIRFDASPDFESPADANGDNTYELTISVSDGSTDAVTQAITIVVTDVNDNTPVITAGQSFANVSEDSAAGTELGAVIATDADAGTTFQSWAITDGNSAGDFAIDQASGVLSVASGASLDFETKPSYTLELTVQDDGGTNTSAAAEISISIADVNEAPTFTSSATPLSVDENSAGVIYTASASDVDASDTQTYSIAGGADQDLFVINGADLSFKSAPDFEDVSGDNTYEVTIRVTDSAGLYADLSLSITVDNVNEAPTFSPTSYSASAPENSTGGFFAAEANDEDAGDTITFSLASGVSDNDLFYIDPSFGFLNFIDSQDYEASPQTGVNQDGTYEVVISASDGDLSSDPDFTLTVTLLDANEAPTFATTPDSATAPENSTAAFYTAAATDQDAGASITYSLVSDSGDNALFTIEPSSGALNFLAAPNHEVHGDADGDGTYNVEISAYDGSLDTATNLELSVTVTNEPEAPTFASASDESLVSENTSAVFYLAEASDDDGDSVSYSLAPSVGDNDLFNIDSATYGELSFIDAPDYENSDGTGADGTYNVTITASDGSLSSTLELAVTVTDVNEAPVFSSTSDSTSAPEDSTATFYTATATDQDAGASIAYSLAGGADDDLFNLDSATGALSFKAAQDREAAANDANTDYTYEVQITASDGTYSTETALSLSVTLENVNEAPTVTNTVTAISVVEDTNSSPVSFQYTITASDPENDSLVYSISGTDAAAFDVDPSTGLITFKDGVSGTPYDPNYEYPSDANDDNLYQLNILASDSALDSSSLAIQVSVTDVSAAPNFVNSSGASLGSGDNFADSASFAENGTGAAYTAITVDDDDTDDFVKYHITGGVDSDLFEITNDQTGEIFFKSAPDYESAQDDGGDNTYIVEVNATDSNDTTVITLSITIDNLNDNAPVITAQSLDVIEDAANGSTVGAVTVSDADEGSGLATTYQNWQITAGDTNSAFAIDASGTITVNDTTQIDYESGTTSYSLSVSVSDGDNTDSGTVTVNINDTNDEAPVINSTSYDLAESASAGTSLGTLAATDPDTGLTTNYSAWTITSGNSDGVFALDPTTGALTVADTTSLDYDNGAQSYDLLVTVSDGANTSAEQTITVNITDVNDEDPVITTGQSFSTNEISPNDTAVGTVAYTDPDTDNTFTWSIESGNTNSAFAIGETTGIITVNDTSQLSYPSTYSLEIKLEDGGATTTAATATVSIAIEENILPTDLAASSEPTKVTLTWSSTSSSGTITYEIYRSSDSGCDLANPSLCPDDALITSATSPQEDTGVTLGTTYYYWIKADRSSDGLSQTSATPISATPKAGLNDTGVDWAGDSDTANNSDCTSTIAASQDCHVGRDATNHDDTDGNAGFSFTKLDSNGNELLASESGHSCVRDNITGLTWEVKDNDYTLHYNRDQDFAHYDTNTSTNGGDNGTDSASFNTCYGYNSSDPATFCNTEAFVDRVNSAGLCGYNDWRMPTYSELLSIADFGELVNGRGIDTSFFPYYNDTFWSSTVRATSSGTGTSAYGVNFTSLGLGGYGRSSRYSVRLVRK